MQKLISTSFVFAVSFFIISCSSSGPTPPQQEKVCQKTLTPPTPAATSKPDAKDFYFYKTPALSFAKDGDHFLAADMHYKSNYSVWSLSQAKGLYLYLSPRQAAERPNTGIKLRGEPSFASISADGTYVAFSFQDPNQVTCTDIYKGDAIIASIQGYGAGFADNKLIVMNSAELKIFDTSKGKLGENVLKGKPLLLLPPLMTNRHIPPTISNDGKYYFRASFTYDGKGYQTGLTTVDLQSGEARDHQIPEPPAIGSQFSTYKDGQIFNDEFRSLYTYGQSGGHEYHVMSYNLNTGDTTAAKLDFWDQGKRIMGTAHFDFDRTLLVADDVLVVDSKTGKTIERKSIKPKEMMAYTHGADFIYLKNGKFLKYFGWAFGNTTNPVTVFDISAEQPVTTLPIVALVGAPKPESPAPVARTLSPAEQKQQSFINFIHRYGPNPESLSAFNYDVGVYCQYRGPRCHEYRKMYQNLEREYNNRAEAANMQRIWDYTRAARAKGGATSEERTKCLQKLTDSINRHTYGKQDWHFDLNSCN